MNLRLPLLILALLAALPLAAADDDNQIQLGDSKFRLTPPPDSTWEKSEKPGAQNFIAYISKNHDAVMAIQLLPPDMEINQAVTDALIKQLKSSRTKSKSKMLLEPTVEPDDRFALKIHERYEVKDGKVADQIHVYRYLGQRIALATVNVVNDDADKVKTYHAAAEDALASTTWPGMKRQAQPQKPATRPTSRPIGKPLSRPTR